MCGSCCCSGSGLDMHVSSHLQTCVFLSAIIVSRGHSFHSMDAFTGLKLCCFLCFCSFTGVQFLPSSFGGRSHFPSLQSHAYGPHVVIGNFLCFSQNTVIGSNGELRFHMVSHLRLVGRDERVNLKLGLLAAYVLMPNGLMSILAQDLVLSHPSVQIPHPNFPPPWALHMLQGCWGGKSNHLIACDCCSVCCLLGYFQQVFFFRSSIFDL